MAGIVGIYASIGEHVPWITKREKYTEAQSESWVNREELRNSHLKVSFQICFAEGSAKAGSQVA